MGDGGWGMGDGSWEIYPPHPNSYAEGRLSPTERLRQRAPLLGGDVTGELGEKSPVLS